MSAGPFVLVALLFLGSASTAAAQVTSQSEPLRIPSQDGRFADMDTNRDGIIQRDEWRGSLQSFRVHDWNRDGMLSGDELRVGRWREGTWEDVDFDPDRPGEMSWTEASFTALDRNRNGVIQRNEWPYEMETFFRADRNRDNRLSRQEFLGQADWDDDRDDRFEDLDLNYNNRIERAEWHASPAVFDWLDSNRNGWLSRAEVTGSANTRPAANARFNAIDYNRSGTITREEWVWSRASFDERDANRDGVLTRREFDTMSDTALARSSATDVRVDPRERWVPTGVYVQAGDRINLNATGSIQMAIGNADDIATPGGSRLGRKAANALFRDQPAGILIGRIGTGAPFVIGTTGQWTAQGTGQLYLGVNDDHLQDNSGEFIVSINVIGR
jgi:Ca2+-binding EF-hand superfamily protein